MSLSHEDLFWKLFNSSREEDVDEVIESHPDLFKRENWYPYGDNESNFGVVENQQAAPVPALVEKITNSIDAILMKECQKRGVDPTSDEAPNSIAEAVEQYFPENSDWDLPKTRAEQAKDIQIIADGLKYTPSLVIYDNGEGQRPERFEQTFLSLLRGNKNEIHFVQGKYNMGGSGALVFCGDKRYQLIGSRRYDESGDFGFTLLRQHPLTEEERQRKKNTWYEYLKVDGEIPSFPMEESMDLGLYDRDFTTGSVLKLYSYNLPSGAKSIITRDLNRHLNEFLFEPALPIYTIEGRRDKYPHDKNPQRDLYGLKRRLEKQEDKYIDEKFSLTCSKEEIGGEIEITCYVFKARMEGKNVKETKRAIRDEFFQNNMRAVFSVNGQVHGHYTKEFISRSLKFGLLKNYLLIHVDVTDLDVEFRNELFMASRDRLKKGDESSTLRKVVAKELRRSRLKDIYKRRKSSMNVESESTEDLVKQFAENLPMDEDMTKLLNQTLELDRRTNGEKKKEVSEPKRTTTGGKEDDEETSFEPERFPTFFRLRSGQERDGRRVVKTPLGGQRSIKFETDVEDEYFDRVREPGDLKLSILDYSPNETKGGDAPGLPDRVDDVFDVVKSSPNEGTIQVRIRPKDEVNVGDAIQTKVSLTAPGEDLNEIFWVKIGKPRSSNGQQKQEKEESDTENLAGLPELVPVFESSDDGETTWDDLEEAGVEMDYGTVMHPYVEDEETLDRIFINMDSRVLLNYKSGQSSEESIQIAENRYLSSVYFHTLFLYTITKNRGYRVFETSEDKYSDPEEVDLERYLKDLFDSYYSEFLLNFETGELIEAIEE